MEPETLLTVVRVCPFCGDATDKCAYCTSPGACCRKPKVQRPSKAITNYMQRREDWLKRKR